MRNCRIDCVFSNIPANPKIIIIACFLSQTPTLLFHLVCGLPCAGNYLAYASHSLTVRSNDGKRPKVMKDILRSDRLATNSAFRKGDILRDLGVEMVTYHKHV